MEIFIEAFEKLQTLTWDFLLVRPCHRVDETSVEVCDREEAEFWTVYYQLTNGEQYAIADCKTEKEAERAVTLLWYFVNADRRRKR